MKATVYFTTAPEVILSHEAPDAAAYLRTTHGFSSMHTNDHVVDYAETYDGYKIAAEIDLPARDHLADYCECSFTVIQNHDTPWTEIVGVECKTDKPRSMSCGDVVALEDGSVWFCAALGFDRMSDDQATRFLAAVS